jgi:ligand-binding sensor domain-containing protein
MHGPANIFALTQTPDGTLWIGTEFGLVRFDGERFVVPRRPPGERLPSEYITALQPSRDGSLWIGTREGLSHWKDNHLTNHQTSVGPSGPGVAAILEDRSGNVWAGSIGYRCGGLCRVEQNRLRCYDVGNRLPGTGVSAIVEDRQGNIWVGGVGGLGRWEETRSLLYPRAKSPSMIYSIAQDSHGEILVGTGEKDLVRRLVDGKLVPYEINVGNQEIHPGVLLFDRDGGLWIGTWGQGLAHLSQGRIDHFTHADGLSNDVVRCLFEDHEGNIWVGTDGGLDRFRDFAVTTITKREGLAGSMASSLLASKSGGVWIGTNNGLTSIQDGKISTFNKKDGLPSNNISGIFEEQGGRLWVNTQAGITYDKHGRFQLPEFTLAKKMLSTPAATEDRNHTLWISDPGQGLVHLRNQHLEGVVQWSEFGGKQAWAIEADRNGDGLWLGFLQGGIAHLRPGHATRWYGTNDGLASGAVVDLHYSRDGSLWIAAHGGMSRFKDGRIQTLGIANGLPCDEIQAMVTDNDGSTWLNTACGLICIAASDLEAWSVNPGMKVRVKLFDGTDGMTTHAATSGYFRSAVRSTDGRLWFAVLDGVAVVDPEHLPHNRLPPPVQIEQTIADRTVYALRSNLSLPPLTKDIEIDYTAFSFVNPEKVRFRYKLESYDGDWQEAGTRRQAMYTNLPPGSYKFRVIACNNDGFWNLAGASMDFSIRPMFYQTKGFQLLGVSAAALLLWSLYRLRVGQIAARLQLGFEMRMVERTRIGNELHDNLLQNISGFALQLDALSKTVAAPLSAKDRLRELRVQAEQWLREAREAVWDLRTPNLDGREFVIRLGESVQQIIHGNGIQFSLTTTGERYPAEPKLEDQLIRIFREAARNAVSHAKAKEIELLVAYADDTSIRIQMRDDGCGFDPEEASLKLGHWGLEIMRERARQVGAELQVSSVPGRGTQLDMIVRIKAHPQ